MQSDNKDFILLQKIGISNKCCTFEHFMHQRIQGEKLSQFLPKY